MSEEFHDGRVILLSGDCRDVIKALPDNSFDSCVTDPPYALVSIVKRFGGPNAAPAKGNDAYMRASAGFMGKTWDTGETAFSEDFWAEVLRVLKPGAHLASFGASRGYHRMACAIEDAGFEVRDSLMWIYGSGFPKSHDVSKGIAEVDAARQWEGWGTALKPAFEPIVLARKPLSEGTIAANVLRWGTGALNIDGCRVGTETVGWGGGRGGSDDSTQSKGRNYRLGAGEARPVEGRWPANVVHDGSDDVVVAFPIAPGQQRGVGPQYGAKDSVNCYGDYGPREQFNPRGDVGSAARFFYSAKADADDRIGSNHPTVKPVDLMQWLVRLVTPPGGRTLEPFAGTGTTAEAAWREGMCCTLIEREEESRVDIRRRMRLCTSGAGERKRESIKAKLNGKPVDHGPLFGEF